MGNRTLNERSNQAATIRDLSLDRCIRYDSYNTRSIQNITSIKKNMGEDFDTNQLAVLQKYAKKIKSFSDRQSIYTYQDIDLISKMQSLEKLQLYLKGNLDMMRVIQLLVKLRNLKSLCLDQSSMGDDQLKYLIQTFPNLQSLSINIVRIKFPGKSLEILNNMKNLKELMLHNTTDIDQAVLESIVENAPQLTKLRFQEGYFSDPKVWKVLEKLQKLKFLELNVYAYQIEHQITNQFQNLPFLPTIESFQFALIQQYLSQKKLLILAEKFPRLEEIHFSRIPSINDSFVTRISELWKNLKVVNFSSKFITNRSIEALVESSPNINILHLNKSQKIHDRSIVSICRLKNLKQLTLNECGLTSRCIIYLGKLKKLETLNLSYNQIDFIGVDRILKSLKLFQFWFQDNPDDFLTKRKQENFNQLTLIRKAF